MSGAADLDRTITVRGLDLRVRSTDAAVADAPVFILLHGIGMSHRSLRRLHEQLRHVGAVHSIDLPGFGGVRRPRHPLPIQAMADLLGAACEQLDIRGATIVGHSMGAQWAMETGVRRPDRIAGVALIGPVADSRRRSVLGQLGGLAVDTVLEPPTANALVVADYFRAGPVWFFRQVAHMLRYPIEERAARLEVPLLVLRGKRDVIATTRWCREIRAGASDGRVVLVPAGAHNVQLTAARAVADAIAVFDRERVAPRRAA